MHVLHLIDGFATDGHSGGASLFAIQLARCLKRSGIKVTVYGLWCYDTPTEHRWRSQLAQEGIVTRCLLHPKGAIGWRMLQATALLHNAQQTNAPTIINSHFERGDVLATAVKWLNQRHRIYTVRTMHTDQQWQTRRWAGKLMEYTWPWAFDAEIAISQATQHRMNMRPMARLRNRHATVIYNGITNELMQRLSAPPRAHSTIPAIPARCAIIGRLEAQKGHRYLLEAIARLAKTDLPAEFWIIGTGELEHELRQQAHHLDITDRVQFLGGRNDVPELLSSIDLLISASLWEGFPTVVLEAMAARVPVIATDVSGSNELVVPHETGFLIPPADALSLAHTLCYALEHPDECRAMAERAWQRVQVHTMEQVAARYQHVYQQLLLAAQA